MARLYVNVDHVATVREARGVGYPDPVELALLAEEAGIDGITMHLREDRRHVQDHDIERAMEACRTPFNFEMAADEEIVRFCEHLAPPQATLVPERRLEVTTEGGLDVVRQNARLSEVTKRLVSCDVAVSLFVDPELEVMDRSAEIGASHVELHTGPYAHAFLDGDASQELDKLVAAAARARELGLVVNAGHGLTTENVGPVAAIQDMGDLNIGHFLIGRAIALGIAAAIDEMRAAMSGKTN